jgi:AraC-like DNA-binding protein
MSHIRALPAPRPRISRKVRDAVRVRVEEGLSIAAAAERAGMSRNGLAKALKRPAVQDLLRETQEAFIRETEALRATYKARALEVALELMHTAKSESVRARMAEFLASDAKAPQVAVHIDARQETHPG